jgi:hypothetical protein
LNTKQAVEMTRKYESGNTVELLYSLLLLYRLTYYRQLQMSIDPSSAIKKKAVQINAAQALSAINMLNNGIIALEHNPNRLLFMLNILIHLP